MKLTQKTLILGAILTLALSATVVRAEDGDSQGDVNAQVNVSTSNQGPRNGQVPPPAGNPPINRTAALRADINNRLMENKDARNNLLQERVELRKDLSSTTRDIRRDFASTTRDMRMEDRDEIKGMREDMREDHASTTAMFRLMKGEIRNKEKQMRADEFNARKAALLKELHLSLTNLANISSRIDERIQKETANGLDMTKAKALLVTANGKLDIAKTAVAALEVQFSASTTPTTTTGTSTPEIDLSKPRQIGDAAIKAVKDARDAYQKVVVEIAHTLGQNLMPPVGTTTPVTASTTASVQ